MFTKFINLFIINLFTIARMYLKIINHKLISHWTDVLKISHCTDVLKNHKP